MGSTAHAWSDLPSQLQTAIPKLNTLLQKDAQFLAFTNTPEIATPIMFGIKASGSPNTILITVSPNKGIASTGSTEKALFTLSTLPEQWEQFFQLVPKMPYQSYWGMFGMNIKQEGIERRALEVLHDAHCGPMPEDPQPETDEDHIVGRYLYITTPVWGRCKIFYEESGEGEQDVVFCHTAGSDGRQYHGVMNDGRMRGKCRMVAFDLPGHGRSFPSRELMPGEHTNTEDAYVGAIAAIVKGLGLKKPIICGASMAGQVCLAVAIRADEVGAAGTIPLQGSDHLDMERQFHDRSPHVNQSLYNPEWIYGLIWHLYSAQAYGIFHGDLDFYFGGWDGRFRVGKIDTKKCPVFMLTGEYDWSNTPEMAQKTADKIPGARHKSMPDLGHFPATENPGKFVPHLLEAIEWIRKTRSG